MNCGNGCTPRRPQLISHVRRWIASHVHPAESRKHAARSAFCWTTNYGIIKFKAVNKTKLRWNSILWNETAGFSLMIALSWLTELLHIPHYLFGETFVPDWNRAMLRTLVILFIWGWVHWITKKMLKRLHYLEEFLRTCSWCRKVCHKGEWMNVDDYFNANFDMRTTHGMCPECTDKWEKDFDKAMSSSAIPAVDSASQAGGFPGGKKA